MAECRDCFGRGRVVKGHPLNFGKCLRCEGTGAVPPAPRKTFTELDVIYDAAHKVWGDHVDACPLCVDGRIFACQTQLDLHEASNTAWNEARRAWLAMTDEEREEWRSKRS